jgi:hypothetical protein
VALLVLLLTVCGGVLPAAALTQAGSAPLASASAAPTPPAPLPASASWGGFELTSSCLRPHYTGCLQVELEGRASSARAGFDSTSGWARVTTDTSGLINQVQISKIVLETQYGVLTESAAVTGVGRPAVATLEGPSHLWGVLCSTRYRVSVLWSARLTDGAVHTGRLVGSWYTAPSC